MNEAKQQNKRNGPNSLDNITALVQGATFRLCITAIRSRGTKKTLKGDTNNAMLNAVFNKGTEQMLNDTKQLQNMSLRPINSKPDQLIKGPK